MTSSSGRNGDHVTSGPHSKRNSTETVRDTQKFTITDKYEIAYGLSEYVKIRLLWRPELGQTVMTSLPVHKERLTTWKRYQKGKKNQLITIGNRGCSFPIRHFYLRGATSSGRNRDFAISGSQRKSNRAETVRERVSIVMWITILYGY